MFIEKVSRAYHTSFSDELHRAPKSGAHCINDSCYERYVKYAPLVPSRELFALLQVHGTSCDALECHGGLWFCPVSLLRIIWKAFFHYFLSIVASMLNNCLTAQKRPSFKKSKVLAAFEAYFLSNKWTGTCFAMRQSRVRGQHRRRTSFHLYSWSIFCSW